jgi:protein TonB
VRIAATIGKDGLVHNLVVVHDPDGALSKSALDAVSKWRYTPYLLDGVPVEVETMINVTYRLGR